MHTVKKVLLTALLPFLSQLATANPRNGSASLPHTALSFTENKGQVTDQYHNQRSDIDYKISAPGINIFIGDGQLHYQWSKAEEGQIAHDKKAELQMPAPVNVTTYRMDVTLVGANRDAEVIATDIQKDKETYYFPGIGKDGLTASLYRKVTYKNIYPNIDWVLYSNGTDLKYDFVVHPGGNPKNIKLQFAGATSLQMQNGSLVATTPFGSITEQKPYSYNAETRAQVPSSFILNNNILSFDVSGINGTLIIDPAIVWATFYGGAQNEYVRHYHVEKNGDIFMPGMAVSTTNIATTGSFQSTHGGGVTDAFLAKFNTNGQRLWATYFGGPGGNAFLDCTVDKYGGIYVVGSADTGTTSLITPGAHQPLCGGDPYGDGCIVKFDANGQRIWATFYGGYHNDQCLAIGSDTSGYVYIAGQTYSNDKISTPGTQQSNKEGTFCGFLTKFDTAGQRQWGTYYGDSGASEEVLLGDLYVDKSGNPVIAGYTSSTNPNNYLTTAGAFQTIYAGGQCDGFIAKYNKANGQFIWATLYGGNDGDYISAITGDDNDNIYIAGSTESTDFFAASLGAYKTTYIGDGSSIIAKFNSAGQRVWGTYYGDTSANCRSICMYNGVLLLSGSAYCKQGVATPGSTFPTYSAATPHYLSKFSLSGQLLYGSYFYLPGELNVDNFSNIYLFDDIGSSLAPNIGTPGAYQPTPNGAGEAYLIKLGPDTAVAINQPYTDTLFCPGSVFNLNYTVTGGFNAGNTFTAQLSDATGDFTSAIDIGVATATASGSISCTMPASTPIGNGYRIRIVASNPAFTSMDDGYDIRIQTSVVPAVSAVAVPGTDVGPWVSVVFTAMPTGGGTAPTYQWRKNGIDISGATSDTYTGVMNIDLMTGDAITVKMISNEPCAMPDSAISAALTINVNLSVADMEAGALKVYPNPTNGLLHITGTNEAMELSLYNAMGQTILAEKQPATATGKHTINFKGIPAGIYLLKVKTGNEIETVRISVQ
jgi:hypothetical protein